MLTGYWWLIEETELRCRSLKLLQTTWDLQARPRHYVLVDVLVDAQPLWKDVCDVDATARAIKAWRGLIAAYANEITIPVGESTARQVATEDNIADAIFHVAVTIDQFLTTGEMAAGRAEFAMRLLLLIRDYIRPLPPNGGPQLLEDFRELSEAFQTSAENMNLLQAESAAEVGAKLLLEVNDSSLQKAIAHLTEAVDSLPDGHPARIRATANLATAISRLRIGDQSDTWDVALRLVTSACGAADKNSDPSLWATAHSNRALVLLERPGGSTSDDFEEAIRSVNEALSVRSPGNNKVDWSYTQLHLGLLHHRRGNSTDRAAAERCYRAALGEISPSDDRPLWIVLQTNLGNLLLKSPIDIQGAMDAAKSALKEVDQVADPIAAGRIYWLLARIDEMTSGKFSAYSLLKRSNALKLIRPEIAPDDYCEIAGELADAYCQLGEWHAAADIYDSMLTAFEISYDSQLSRDGRRRVLGGSRIARWASYVFAKVGMPDRAVEVIERGRARELGLAARREITDLTRLSEIYPILASEYTAALSSYRSALNNANQISGRSIDPRELLEAERSVRKAVSEIRQVSGFEAFLRPMTAEEISTATGGIPVCYLINAPWGGYALTVDIDHAGNTRVRSSEISEISSMRILAITIIDMETGEPGLLAAQKSSDKSLLPAAIQRLSRLQPLIEPVRKTLVESPERRVIVVPTGILGMIPLHAIPVGGGKMLDDLGEVYLAPSAAVYSACRARASKLIPTQLVALADTDPRRPLPGSRKEISAIRRIFAVSGIPSIAEVGSKPDLAWLSEYSRRASHLHFACHGEADLSDPIGGCLQLGEGDLLTMEELADGSLENCRIVVASACKSGHYAAGEAPEEFLGLPAGFLQAGAACAVATLWPISDHATAALMTRFYELLDVRQGTMGRDPVWALREARRWLRNITITDLEGLVRRNIDLDLKAILSATREEAESILGHWRTPKYWAAFVAYGC
jgi:CHAT domain-containing protein/tetratricopeptide (TPR) repeat protein